MFKLIATIIAVFGIIVGEISGQTTNDQPPITRCTNNLQCPSGMCCLLGPSRYSVPTCRQMQQGGEQCRPNNPETINGTFNYPDGSQIQVTDIHFILCPCIDGQNCDNKKGVCRNARKKRGFNHSLYEAITQDD